MTVFGETATHRDLIHAKVLAISGSRLGSTSGIGGGFGVTGCASVVINKIVRHLCIELLGGLWLGATGVTTTSGTSASSASTSSGATILGSRNWLRLRLALTTVEER